MRGLMLVGGGFVVVACASETEGASAGSCGGIVGNYEVTITRLGGSCPPSTGDNKASLTVQKKASGEWNVSLPGIDGGCPGEFDPSTCKMTALCKIVDLASNRTLASFNLDYTFTSNGFDGTLVGTQSPPLVSSDCDATARHEGTKL